MSASKYVQIFVESDLLHPFAFPSSKSSVQLLLPVKVEAPVSMDKGTEMLNNISPGITRH